MGTCSTCGNTLLPRRSETSTGISSVIWQGPLNDWIDQAFGLTRRLSLAFLLILPTRLPVSKVMSIHFGLRVKRAAAQAQLEVLEADGSGGFKLASLEAIMMMGISMGNSSKVKAATW